MNPAFSGEMETMLIPLYGKAEMNRKGIFRDPFAGEALEKLGLDAERLKIRNKTQVMLALRAAILDEYTGDFIRKNPGCTVLHLGCGLDARYLRLGAPACAWYDLDFPTVIEVKKRLYRETAFYHTIASSVAETGWMDGVRTDAGNVLAVAEGLFMYLSQDDIRALLAALKAKFHRCTVLFDAYSTLTAKNAKHHPSLKRTGATIRWGIDDPKALESYVNGVRYVKTLYLTDERALHALPRGDRLMFRIAGRFQSAREAHRILVLTIGEPDLR